jgi:DNA-binding GntR family transcriptional regulator
VRENVRFHEIVLEAAGSARLAQLVRGVVQLPLVYRSFYWYSPEQKLISEHYHRQLTSALGARDAERAEIVMKEHVLEARDFLVAKVREGTGSL